MSASTRDDFQIDNQNQDDDNGSPARGSSSESSSSSINITDDCFNDIQQRLNDADITVEDHLRVRVYLQPGVPGSYDAEELTSLIASMPDASSKSVHLYLHHFDKNSPIQYAALLEAYKAKQALNDKKVFRKANKWLQIQKTVEHFSQLSKSDKEILADILYIGTLDLVEQQASSSVGTLDLVEQQASSSVGTLDLEEQQASSSVRNVVLMDRSVSDNVRAILVKVSGEYNFVILGKYDVVLEPLKSNELPVVERPFEPRKIDQRLFLETANQIYTEDPERGMMFIESFTKLVSVGRGSALSPTATPPHTHNSFEAQSTPGLRRVNASDSTDDDDLFAKPPHALSAVPSRSGLFGVGALNRRTSVGATTTVSSATATSSAFNPNMATANDTIIKRF